MSIDYYFCCMKCRKVVYGFNHRGETHIIDSFQFIMKHTFLCGTGSVTVLSENNYVELQLKCQTKCEVKHEPGCTCYEQDEKEDLNGYFPRSDEWEDHSAQFQKYLDYINKENNNG